jgi:hypothetical protein
MDKFSIRTIILIGFLFLAAAAGMSVAVLVVGKVTHPPASYECHFPKVTCAPASSS